MKRLFSLLVVLTLLLQLPAAHATGGDPNIEGGGGGMGGAIGDSGWNPGDDGVRVSVMRGANAEAIFDISNIERTRTQMCFVKHNKLYYKNGGGLVPQLNGSYTNWTPPSDVLLPTIIPSRAGGNNIDAIRSYFTDERVVHFIADKAGMTYEELTSGDYKLMLEPIAYFKYNGIQYAMTATEAALFDVAKSGDLKYQMWSLTHQNQPLAMYLERADLGIDSWGGAVSGRQSNIDIINYLGVGIVSFFPEDLDPDPPQGENVYRCDTEVITSVLVPNYTGEEMTPSSDDYTTFVTPNGTYHKQMICPARKNQLMWVKWRTPSTPGEYTITVIPAGVDERDSRRHIAIPITVVELEERTPPDPGYDGPLEGPGITHTEYRPNFRPVDPPDWGSNTRATWSQWVAEWVQLGWYNGYWKFSMASYEAELTVDYRLEPSERCPTAELRGSTYKMKSGYGVRATCDVTVSAHATGADVTPAQHVLAVFPEFDYQDFYRLLWPDSRSYRALWQFQVNPYSYYGEEVHYTPIWYPDTDYTVPVAVFDAWTPGGQLWATEVDTMDIRGSAYDDWYIRVY